VQSPKLFSGFARLWWLFIFLSNPPIHMVGNEPGSGAVAVD